MSRLLATSFFSLLLALSAVPSTHFEFSKLDEAAARVATKLASPVPHIVEVADFTAPDGSPSKQGEYLAFTFAHALQFHGQASLLVKDHREFDKLLVDQKISPSLLVSQPAMMKLAKLTGVDVLVTGTIEKATDHYAFRVSAIRVPDGKVLDSASGQLPSTDFLDSLDKPFPPKTDFPIERGGHNGVSLPVCQNMPDPRYNDFARELRIEGSIVLEALLSPDGRFVAAHPVKLLGGGLEEECLRTLMQWKCKPATKPDGTPVYAVVPVEFTFRVNFNPVLKAVP